MLEMPKRAYTRCWCNFYTARQSARKGNEREKGRKKEGRKKGKRKKEKSEQGTKVLIETQIKHSVFFYSFLFKF